MWSFSSLYDGGLRTALALLRVVGVCLSVCLSQYDYSRLIPSDRFTCSCHCIDNV